MLVKQMIYTYAILNMLNAKNFFQNCKMGRNCFILMQLQMICLSIERKSPLDRMAVPI